MRSNLRCPVCNGALEINGSYRCENNHCFDISRYKTVNLLMNQSSSAKRHGDDKLMVAARRDFLDAGYYLPFAEKIAQTAKKFCCGAEKSENDCGSVLLADIGCGEGYYTRIVADALSGIEAGENQKCEIVGIDISKDALRYAKRRVPEGEFAVASAFSLPLADKCCDIILNIFAPYSADEFMRTLKDDGIVIRAFARKNHLLGLKQAVYDEVRNDDVQDLSLDGFEMIDCRSLEYNITLKNAQDIDNLFKMTPYYYKTSKEGQRRLSELENLDTPVHFNIATYRKANSI